ncbi:MAG: hypothetical protein K2W93_16400 [Burkholderiaceae bacterium]|uniref:hypothetical protein n=1 Tax=Paucibacter sp. KCTC 42545 TaxID=1768242 RepID=UPI000733C483|nr:hypothetical protein [Paucibacter sp. KCTC 42545]ALT77657.1 hypothetical protein AT984_11150 [Paucibacter sp. KCTC 42545]MBY0236562.1 hypothetical protein [Burkholderiaceae bacterium]
MWKLFVGFIIFAALALYILTKSGGDIDMGGEKHDVAAPHSEVAPSAPAAAASEALPAASAAASAASM